MKIFYQKKNEITLTTDAGMQYRCSLDELDELENLSFIESVKVVFANSVTQMTMRMVFEKLETWGYAKQTQKESPNPRVFYLEKVR